MNINTRQAILMMLAIALVVGVGGYLLVKLLLPESPSTAADSS